MRFLPLYILDNLQSWIEAVNENGIEETRKAIGYHDEPLTGARKGQRSIRLNRAYRAIYIVRKENSKFIEIIEINKHDY